MVKDEWIHLLLPKLDTDTLELVCLDTFFRQDEYEDPILKMTSII